MADRGILFSAPMVRALLDGRKTQTRRLLRNPEYFGCPTGDCPHDTQAECDTAMAGLSVKDKGYAPGDQLWVRETCRAEADPDEISCIRYLADDSLVPIANSPEAADKWLGMFHYAEGPADRMKGVGKTVVSIHMPRWASRITLTVTDVRVERLQAISREDAIAEGLIHKRGVIEPDWWMLPEPLHQGTFLSPVAAYAWLWNSLHDKVGERWEDDPWVVAVSFDVREGNIDA